jgi:xylulose-5-phosphate/fructose-6-phosphate phosphoketolase
MNLPTKIDQPGAETGSSAQVFGEALRDELEKNKDFYFFSPDETTSNRLSAVFEASDRAWTREIKDWDQHLAPNGHVIEMLSENTLFATLAGHILSGGRGCMTSYESFLPIISSQLDQHLKFLKQSKEYDWRPDVQALNILSTSCWQRQDHNGYTHQNPSLITSLLSKPSNLANCFFPVDDVAAAACWEYMSKSKNVVNLTTFNKNPQPRWIDINHARYQLGDGHGCSIYQFASDDDPDLTVAAIGDIPTAEALEGIKIAKKAEPSLKVRFVGIAALSYAAIGTTDNKLRPHDFDDIFVRNKPIVVNFHGYQETIRAIFSHYVNPIRVSIHGYEDQGSTTSPLDELARNHCSRFDIAADILERTGHYHHTGHLENTIIRNARHAHKTGLDAE